MNRVYDMSIMKILLKPLFTRKILIVLSLALCVILLVTLSRNQGKTAQTAPSPSNTQNPLNEKSWLNNFEWRKDPTDQDTASLTLTLRRDQNTITGDHCWYSGHGSFLDCNDKKDTPRQSITGTIEGSTAHLILKSYRDDHDIKGTVSWNPKSSVCEVTWQLLSEEPAEFPIAEQQTLACKYWFR